MSVLVATEAPDFTSAAVMPDGTIEDGFSLSSQRGKCRAVLLAFRFHVCLTI